MFRTLIFRSAFLAVPVFAAPAADHAPAVVSAVQKVFDAMTAKDTVALSGAFLPDAAWCRWGRMAG